LENALVSSDEFPARQNGFPVFPKEQGIIGIMRKTLGLQRKSMQEAARRHLISLFSGN
jgi:hypothetical protein